MPNRGLPPPTPLISALARTAAVFLIVLLLFGLSTPSASASTHDHFAAARPEEGEVTRLYRSVFDRAPDPPGFRYWVTARIEGLSLEAVADGFLNSPEFGLRFGDGSDADFLDVTYRNVLGRPGDRAGSAYWMDKLRAGLPRTELVLLFSESLEHRLRTGTAKPELPDYEPSVLEVSTAELGRSWRAGCPVPPVDLVSITVDHVDFAGQHRRGTLIVNGAVADEVIAIFRQLYQARYPIDSMIPIDRFDGDDDLSMAANNTSAFNCRAVTGGSSWSRHAFGTAIDLNPAQNPYVAGRTVLPPVAADHLDRARYHPAMIRPGDVVTRSFAAAGWRWGGDFVSLKDYQHFQR